MTVSQRILDAWDKNAQAWAKTVRENALASRRLVTDAAIVEQLLSEPDWSSLLDVGCGEGWLIRTLKSERPDAHFTGFDGCAALIDTARADDRDGDYRHLTYQQVHRDRFSGPFDRIVCNFSLFEDESVVELLQRLRDCLTPQNGRLAIQTLYSDAPKSEWEADSWSGLPDSFREPHPWFKRCEADWFKLFTRVGLEMASVRYPAYPDSDRVASVIFVLKTGNRHPQ
jgi:2-polyprenyl-3-methyl-5-hydroxy-6-metoxy-1,4-benzoquinol methylase